MTEEQDSWRRVAELLEKEKLQAEAALADRDAELAKLRALPSGMRAEYGRLDVMWQELVAERDRFKAQLATAKAAVVAMSEAESQVVNDLKARLAAVTGALRNIQRIVSVRAHIAPHDVRWAVKKLADAALATPPAPSEETR